MAPIAKTRIGRSTTEANLSPRQVDSLLDTAISPLDRDLAALNYEFLRLVRESACCEQTAAAVRFGLNEGVLKLIASSSLEDLRRMARTGISMFRVVPRSETAWIAAVSGACDTAMMISGGSPRDHNKAA